MIKIAFFNQKGGTGKTTSTINVAGYLATKYKKKVLIVDCDPQANTTNTLMMESDATEHTILDAMAGTSINECIYPALIKSRENARAKNIGIDVIPTTREMGAIDLENEYVVKQLIQEVNINYDYILFDCPPYLSDFTINILAASDYVIVPATVDKDSLDGFGELIDTVNMLKVKNINNGIRILGVFLTMYNSNEAYDSYIANECRENFGSDYIDNPIRRSTYAKQASHFGRPLCLYKKNSKVSMDYESLTDKIVTMTI